MDKTYFNSKVSKKYNFIISDEAQQSINHIKRYFDDKESPLQYVRNKFGFHYDADALLEDWFPEDLDKELLMYISNNSDNTLCYV